MGDTKKTAENTKSVLVKRLNKALRVEYSLIIHYPYIANLLRDPEAKKLATELGAASIHHSEFYPYSCERPY
jgi:rubrerythrin